MSVQEYAGAGSLAVAAELGAALAATTDLTDLLRTLQRQLKWLLPATYVSLCLLEDDGRHYRVLVPDGNTRVYSLEEGLVGLALRTRSALDVLDLQDETRLPPGIGGVALHQGQGAVLVLPLKTDDHLLGALTIESPQVGVYSAVERGLISLVVPRVAATVLPRCCWRSWTARRENHCVVDSALDAFFQMPFCRVGNRRTPHLYKSSGCATRPHRRGRDIHPQPQASPGSGYTPVSPMRQEMWDSERSAPPR